MHTFILDKYTHAATYGFVMKLTGYGQDLPNFHLGQTHISLDVHRPERSIAWPQHKPTFIHDESKFPSLGCNWNEAYVQ